MHIINEYKRCMAYSSRRRNLRQFFLCFQVKNLKRRRFFSLFLETLKININKIEEEYVKIF